MGVPITNGNPNKESINHNLEPPFFVRPSMELFRCPPCQAFGLPLDHTRRAVKQAQTNRYGVSEIRGTLVGSFFIKESYSLGVYMAGP